MIRRRLVTVTVLLLLLLALGLGVWHGCSPDNEDQRVVRVARTTNVFVVPFMAADRDKIWAREGVNVETQEFVAGRLCLDALLGGSADLATVADVPIVNATLQEHELEILATFVSSYGHVRCVARTDRGIQTPADLKNKRIGAFLGTTMEFGMMKFLSEHNLSLSDVEVANVKPPEIVAALVRGDVDAAFDWEPFVSEMKLALGEKAVVFPPGKNYRATFSLLSRPGFAEDHPEEVRKILSSLRAAIDQVNGNRDDTVKLVADKLKLEPGRVAGFLDYYQYELSLDESLLRLLEDQARWVIETSDTPDRQIPKFQRLFNVAPLKAVDPKAVTVTGG